MMNKTSALRGLLGVAVAIALAGAAPAAAATRGSPGQTGGLTASTTTQAVTCTAGSKACPIRISFASGAYSGQAHSQLTGITSVKWFVVNARAEQHMIVIVEGAGPTRGIVYFPNGQSAGQPGGRVFDQTLPVSGDYKIRVSESTMGEAWSGRVDVLVVIY
jgi:hypothetical protein